MYCTHRTKQQARRPCFAAGTSISRGAARDPLSAELEHARGPLLARFGLTLPPKRKSAATQHCSRNGTTAIVWDVASGTRISRKENCAARSPGDTLARTKETGPAVACLLGSLPCERTRTQTSASKTATFCASSRRNGDTLSAAAETGGTVLNQHSPLVAAGAGVPDFHSAAGVKGEKAGGRPTSSRPARTATSGGSACSGSPGSRQRRSCRPCRRS